MLRPHNQFQCRRGELGWQLFAPAAPRPCWFAEKFQSPLSLLSDLRSPRAGRVVPARSLRGEEHGQDRGVRMADWVHPDAADHTRHRAVGFRLHPGGAMFQAQIRQSGQQYAP